MQKGFLSDKIGTFRGRGVSRETRKCFPSGHEMLLPRYTAEYQRNVGRSSKRYPFPFLRSRYGTQETSYYLFLSGKTLLALLENRMLAEFPINVKVNCSFMILIARVLFRLYVYESDVEFSWKLIKNFNSWRWGKRARSLKTINTTCFAIFENWELISSTKTIITII